MRKQGSPVKKKDWPGGRGGGGGGGGGGGALGGGGTLRWPPGNRQKAACCLAGPLCADKEGVLDGNLRDKVAQVTATQHEPELTVKVVTAYFWSANIYRRFGGA